jgi:preprotein translocase subunit YajC
MSAILDPIRWLVLAADQAPPPAGWEQMFSGPWVPLIMVMGLFYFLMIRPERRKRAAMQEMLQNLKKNDRVVTVGGIYGTIANVPQEADDVTIRVDDSTNTRLRIQRSAIARVRDRDDASTAEGAR